MRKIFIVLILVVIGAIALVAVRNRGQDIKPEDSGTEILGQIPALALKDFGGKEVKLPDFHGRPLVVNSWAVWCPFCVKELADFAAIQKEFGSQIVILAIDRQESSQTAKDFTDRLGITSDLIFLLDPNDSFYRSIGGFSMPETIFVDRNGNIVDHKRGPMDLEEIRQRIQKIIDYGL